MSRRPQPLELVPEDTARVARAAFPTGHPSLTLRDQLGTIFQDEAFAALFPACGQLGLSPWRLALVTIMPFREPLADRQAAEAVRARIDWKYLLGLELTDPGVDCSVLGECRGRLLAGHQEEILWDTLLEPCGARGLLKARGPQRTAAPHGLAAIRVLTRLELVAATFRAALHDRATVAPDWRPASAPVAWYERDGRRLEDSRLPTTEATRPASAQTVGAAGFSLLDACDAPEGLQAARALPVIDTLRRTWQRHDERTPGEAAADGTPRHPRVRLKTNDTWPPAAEGIESPDDADARYRHTRDTPWPGSMVQIRAACEPTAPHLVTPVQTTPATVHEAPCTEPIQQALVAKDLPPSQHVVDAASIAAAWLVTSREAHGIMRRGPTRPNISWPSQANGGYRVAHVSIDWARQQGHGPQGKTSGSWAERVDHMGSPYIQVRFRQHDCRDCQVRALCTRATRAPRSLKLHPQEPCAALQAARIWSRSEEGQQRDQRRAGVEGTLSQGVRAFGLRDARYRGLTKAPLQHVATAAAINMERLVAWLNERPRAKTRISRFAALAPA